MNCGVGRVHKLSGANAAALVLALVLSVPAHSQTIGERCTSGDTASRPGISCQVTDEWEWTPPYIQNAKKGDVILTAGCGMIGELLRQVSPPQHYSHSGIMTRDYFELRNSTAADSRYKDHIGTEGFNPNVLKYGWPGTITQTVEDAYLGAYMTSPPVHPETVGRVYRLRTFSSDPVACNADLDLSYPLVVKPPIDGEGAVRPLLHEIADEAGRLRGHYRWGAYSDASMLDDASRSAPAEIAWATRDFPRPTVCSQLIWAAARNVARGRYVIEGASEDRERPPAGVDGLYVYSETERQAAGNWLYASIYNAVYEVAGDLGRLFTDAPDDTANQLANCFASDFCSSDAKDSENWRTPGPGRAISPDDIMQWDAPPRGVYGYSERLVYRDGSYSRVYRWQEAVGAGGVSVRVLRDAAPVPGATITFVGATGSTDASGRFTFRPVPAGRYEVSARKTFLEGGAEVDAHAERIVSVAAGPNTAVDLSLSTAPAPTPGAIGRRLVSVFGDIFVQDYETFGSNETNTFRIDESVVLDPVSRRDHRFQISRCVGDEVRVEIDVWVTLNSSTAAVSLLSNARFYEGTDCDTSDREDIQSLSLSLDRDATATLNYDLFGDDRDDFARVRLQVSNRRSE